MNDISSPFGAYVMGRCRAALTRCAQATPANWFGRRGALILRKMVLWRGPVIVDAVVEGLRFRLYMKDNVSERKYLFLPQFFDAAERAALRDYLPAGGIFVDVGANAGIYSMRAADRVGKNGRVISFEPNPKAMERLVFNAHLNGFSGRIVFDATGISDSAGSFSLILDDTNLGGSSLVYARGIDSVTVACDTLLNRLRVQGVERIDALKIDIEGAEDRALIPFFRTAPGSLFPRLLIVENSPRLWQDDLPAALTAAGYRLAMTTRMNQIWIRA